MTFLVPIFGTLWGALFLGEQITISTMAGCGVVLAGTALVTGVRLGTRSAESSRQSRLDQSLERIQHPNVRTLKIGFVARDQNETSV